MQYVKKISAILLIWFMIFSVGVTAKQIEKRKIETYTFNYYVSFLNSVLIPDIEKFIDGYDLLPVSKEKGKMLIQGIISIIQSHIQSNNIIVPPGHHYPVSLILIPPDQNAVVVYYINVVIPLIEYDERGKITSMLIISKNFFCGREILSEKQKV